MSLQTRKPSGLPAWPLTLIAGMQSAGKTYLCAEASASPLVSRTLWVGYGELDPDDYADIAGANFEIVDHDGTVRGVIAVLEEIAALDVPAEGPILLVFDSSTRYWQTIGQNVQYSAATRAKESRAAPDDNVDLWDSAKSDWQAMLNALRKHRGPVLITARLEETPIFAEGKPTKDSTFKVQGEKSLPYDVDVFIELRRRGDYTLAKVKSALMEFAGPRPWPGFTVDALWRGMGLDVNTPGDRHYAMPVTDGVATADKTGRDWLKELDGCKSASAVVALGAAAANANASAEIRSAIRKKHTSLSPK